jgi:GT2 family glycosyltransferase
MIESGAERVGAGRISIVVPAYNGQETIEDCLRAVFAAEYPRDLMEVIVVDDGSSDRTPEILRLLQDQGLGFTVIRQDNQGAAGCRDRGIKTATGEVIFIISQDTFAEKDWFTVVVAEFSRNPRLGIVQGRVALTEPIDCPFYHAVELNAFVWNFPTAAIAYRAEALDRAGRYFDSLFSEYGDDTDVAWRIIEHGYDYTWLDRLTARHGVYPKDFWYPIRRTFPRTERFPLLVRRHPGIRGFLLRGFLWSTPRRIMEILLLLTSPVWFALGGWVALGVAGASVVAALHRHRGTGSPRLRPLDRYLLVPINSFICEVLGFLAMLYGSVRYRSVVL